VISAEDISATAATMIRLSPGRVRPGQVVMAENHRRAGAEAELNFLRDTVRGSYEWVCRRGGTMRG